MRTLNISITDDQLTLINKLIQKHGFANRSEFFRAIIRALNKPFQISPSISFQSPPTRNINQIVSAFRKSGKYNRKFLTSLEKGLRESSYFNSSNQ